MIKPYVIAISQNDASLRFALDRSYTLIPDNLWDRSIDLKNIIEVSSNFSSKYAQPDWAKDQEFITLWTNYYE